MRLVSSLPERGSCFGFEDLSSVMLLYFNIYNEKFLPGIYNFYFFFFKSVHPLFASQHSSRISEQEHFRVLNKT